MLSSLRTGLVAIMGCCSSICGSRPDDEEGNAHERTHLLVDPVRNEPAPLRPQRTAQPARKPDEQSALSKILQDTITNVIDVGALGTHPIEPHDYTERVNVYQARLGGGGNMTAAILGTPPPQPKLLRDVSHAEKAILFAQEPIAPQDKQMIGDILVKAASAMTKLKVEHREDLVVPFKIP